ncbi:unnamed protein product [Rotaria sp. Silwood2]|nr:unnamed protein product [Rotaria sp. Silwood2]
MSNSNDEARLRKANFRLCRICKWSNYRGFGFSLERSPEPPHLVQTVDSNSPASAADLKIRDVVLAVNDNDVSKSEYNELATAISNARDSNDYLELLVIEKRYYDILKEDNVSFSPRFAKIIDTPKKMPRDYMNFPKHTPRTCDIRLTANDQAFGFNIAPGKSDIGAFIQDIAPNSPASKTALRKSDRILEINDKFVDEDRSKTIEEKVIKAKSKRSVKLYVVDTHTYAYFQENNIPLQSKKFQKSSFAKNKQIPSYEDAENNSFENNDADDSSIEPLPPALTPHSNQQSNISDNVDEQKQHSDDIRLCTITRSNEQDKWGFSFNYNDDGHYCSINILSGPNNRQSNAALAGIKSEDRLIEINGENIQNLTYTELKQRINDIRYPQSLQMLVADAETFNNYKEKNKPIHSKLQSVKYLSKNKTDRSLLTISSAPEDDTPKLVKTITQPPSHESSRYGITNIGKSNPLEPKSSKSYSQSHRQNYELRRNPDFPGFGFRVSSTGTGIIRHKIAEIMPNSPAEQQGLPVGYNIIAINNRNVQHMNANEFKQCLSQSAHENKKPLLLDVIDEDSDRDQRSSSLSQSSISTSRIDVNEVYPTMRHCVIQSRPQYQQLGFKIIQSPKTSSKDGGYQIKQLETDSPAALTNILNDDYIIEINGVNIEKEDYQYVQDLIRESYRKNQKIELLVIDDDGYQWYKNRQYPIDPLSTRASVVRYNTSDPPRMDMPYDTNSTQSSARVRPIDNSRDGKQKSKKSNINGSDLSSNNPYTRLEKNPNVASSLYASQGRLSRGTVDIVSEKRFLRLCRVKTVSGQVLGFDIKSNDSKHIICNIQPNSPAARAGLNENDRLIEVNDDNILDKSYHGKKCSV